MITRHSRNGVAWVDLESPSREELRTVMDEFGIGARVEEEIISPTPYPLVLSCPKYIYLILHFPVPNPSGGARSQEVDFIVGKKFLITVRYEVVESLHSLHRVFEAEELLGLPTKSRNADALVERVLRHLYGAIREQTEQSARTLERIEENIFAGKEREMVRAISLAGRVLLRFDSLLSRHAESLSILLEELAKPTFFGKPFEEHAAHIQAEHDHTVALVRSYREVAIELRRTNESLLTSSQNEVMKILTIMAFVTFPLMLVTSAFGMNTSYLPLVGLPGDFWIVIAIMTLLTISFYTYFRIKKWL